MDLYGLFLRWRVFYRVSLVSGLCGPSVALPVVCGRFLGCFARFLWAVSVLRRSLAAFQVCRLWSDALRPCLASYIVRCGLLFCFVGSSSPAAAFSFCGPLDALRLLAALPLLGVVVVCCFWVWFARCFFGFLLGSCAASSVVIVLYCPRRVSVPLSFSAWAYDVIICSFKAWRLL